MPRLSTSGRTRTLPRLLALATAAVAITLMGACSDEDDPTPAPGTNTGTATAATTATPTSTEGAPTGATTAPATATATATPTASPTATFPPAVEQPRSVGLVPAYGSVVLDRPVELLAYPIGGYEMLLAEQGGVLYALRDDGGTPVLDIRSQVRREGNEEGLLSVALDPAFRQNGHVWVYYSASSPRRTVLSRFVAGPDGVIDASSELVVLEQEQPYSNHNGGAVRFGPDGMLYLGLGDGGSGGDPQGNAQNPGTLLGSIIRIDVSRASAAEPYAIPADNPLVGTDARGEVWAYGLRNPWRMSFDPESGELWGADVGQGAWEEVDILRAGQNYGWPILEGNECYRTANCDRSGLTPPVAVYSHGGGRCSVTGGVVARGVSATAVEGSYLFGDHCSGELWALSTASQGEEPVLIASVGRIASISQVGSEVYVLSFGQPLLRLVDQ